MSFFVPEIFEGRFVEFESASETAVIPEDALGEGDLRKVTIARLREIAPLYVYNEAEGEGSLKITVKTGVLGRLSAPGYLDATDWVEFASRAEAEAELSAVDGALDNVEEALDEEAGEKPDPCSVCGSGEFVKLPDGRSICRDAFALAVANVFDESRRDELTTTGEIIEAVERAHETLGQKRGVKS